MPSAPNTGASAPASHSYISKQDAADLATLDSTIDAMRAFTPHDPYVLTIPQYIEPRYHHSFRYQQSQWLDHTPFEFDEEPSVQYQTFHYHEHGKETYLQETNSQLEERLDQRRNKGRPKERPATPAVDTGPKKKISLAAYKSKQAGGTPTPDEAVKQAEEKAKAPPAGKAPVKGPIERVKHDEFELPALDLLVEEDNPLKRKRERVDTPAKSEDLPHAGTRNSDARLTESPSKKPRLEEPPTNAASSLKAPAKLPIEHPSPPQEMPPRLSPPPTLAPQRPAAKSAPPLKSPPVRKRSMPARLSPTLPANIAASLEARSHERSSSKDTAPSSSSKKDSLREVTDSKSSMEDTSSPDGVVKLPKKITPTKAIAALAAGVKRSPTPKNGFRANSGSPAVRAIDGPPRSQPELSQDEEAAIGKALKEKKQELVVKFKVKKHQKERLKQILKMRPRPAKDATPQPSAVKTENPPPEEAKKMERRLTDRRDRDTNARGVAQKIGPSTNSVSFKGPVVEKRARDEESSTAEPPAKRGKPSDEDKDRKKELPPRRRSSRPDQVPYQPPGKRKHAPEALNIKKEDPATPVQPDLKSPTLLSSGQKSQQVTPTNTRKDLLSVAMNRDKSSDSNVHTPSAQSRTPAGVAIGHTSQPNGAAKSFGVASNKTPMQVAWEAEQKRLDSLGRELKHATQGHLQAMKAAQSDGKAPSAESKLAAVKSIESLISYILAFSCADEASAAADPKKTPAVGPWRTLTGFFGFVKRNCEPFPQLTGLACLLGVVFNGRILAITAAHPAEGPSRDSLIETNAALMRAETEAKSKLPLRTIQRDFPKTWAAGFSDSAVSDRLAPEKYAGPFELPIGQSTASMQGVRAGMSLLEEWCAKEGMEYNMKVRL